jgi:CheY-like chemotaxis protein
MNFPKKVFLIDDDDEEYYILSAALNECYKGIELLYEKNANAALVRLANDNTDTVAELIFLDWRMPKVSGKEVLSSIRKLPHYTQIPIVIFTGNIDPVYLNEAKELGATFVMQKPFDLTDLYQKLKGLFSLNWRHVSLPGQEI